MDLRHVDYFARMGRSAMQQGNYDQGLQFLSMGLDLLQSYPLHMHFAAPFLADRAECLWQLGDEKTAVQNMADAINAGLPLGNLNCEVNVIEISMFFCFFLHSKSISSISTFFYGYYINRIHLLILQQIFLLFLEHDMEVDKSWFFSL